MVRSVGDRNFGLIWFFMLYHFLLLSRLVLQCQLINNTDILNSPSTPLLGLF